jgi:beta-phosphoglucomutase
MTLTAPGVPRAVIFDLDGVLVDTATLHRHAWQRIADEHGFSFDDAVAEQLKGVSRDAALRVVLRAGGIELGPDELVRASRRKNEYYNDALSELDATALLPGAAAALGWIRARGVPIALASASRNARAVLARTGIEQWFDVIVDGTVVPVPKPDPAVFFAAVAALGVPASDCLVFEDALAGVQGALRAGCRVIGIGDPAVLGDAEAVVASLADISWPALFGSAA